MKELLKFDKVDNFFPHPTFPYTYRSAGMDYLAHELDCEWLLDHILETTMENAHRLFKYRPIAVGGFRKSLRGTDAALLHLASTEEYFMEESFESTTFDFKKLGAKDFRFVIEKKEFAKNKYSYYISLVSERAEDINV